MSVAMRKRPASKVTAESFLSGIDALLPTFRARAGEVERRGMIPPDVVRMLIDAHVFRAVQPVQWGGLELDAGTFFEGVTRIATACGSTGWVASVVGIHPWHIALFDDRAQQDVWADDPDTMTSTSYAPTGEVRRVPGGFRLSGRWSFSSGVDHCGWVIVGCLVPEDDNSGLGPEFRSFLVPRRDFVIDPDSWRVTGLAGTGSKDVIIAEAFVPEYRTHSSTNVYERSDPGFAVNDRPLYRLPWSIVFPYAIASPAIGIAQGALDLFVAHNRDRVSSATSVKVSTAPGLHLRLAESVIEVEAARTRQRNNWREFQALVSRGEEIPYLARARARFDAAHALAHCAGAVFRVLEVNGGRTMRADEPFQRLFRDLLAMRNHVSAGLENAATVYAKALLGEPPDPFVRSRRLVL